MNADQEPPAVWDCVLLGESEEALYQRAQRMAVINVYAFAGYKMEGTEHESYINEAEEKGYRKNPLVDMAWHIYQIAINFENPDKEHARCIGKILKSPGDPELDSLFEEIGFKDAGKALLESLGG